MGQKESGTGPFGRDVSWVPNSRRTPIYRFIRSLIKIVMSLWFRPIVEGPGGVPSEGPAIIAPIHRSNLDFAFSVFLTDRRIFFMAKDSLWKWKLLGRFLVAMGAFPVHRGSPDRSALSHATAVLEGGEVLVIFPEGTRQEGPTIRDIHEGAAFLSSRTRAPIIPVGIGGSALAMPKGSKFPRPWRIRLFLGPSIQPYAEAETRRVPRSKIHETTVLLQEQLQSAFENASS